eukprot:3763688-Rhodomonas_salina.2
MVTVKCSGGGSREQHAFLALAHRLISAPLLLPPAPDQDNHDGPFPPILRASGPLKFACQSMYLWREGAREKMHLEASAVTSVSPATSHAPLARRVV